MSKEITKVEETKGGLPAFLQDQLAQDAGKGLSDSADDNLVPLIYILQANSPQCNKRSPEYVEGAEAGAIWLRNSGKPAISGVEGITFQHCYFSKDWVEWKPNRGGYVTRHVERPLDAKQKNIDPQHPDRLAWVRENGNIVVETRYHVGNVFLPDMIMPYVIPMASTGHTVSKGWMARMNAKTGNGGPAPSWACLYQLTTKLVHNDYGEWMTWVVDDAGWVQTLDDYERGARLNASFAAGEKSIEAEEDNGQSATNNSRETM